MPTDRLLDVNVGDPRGFGAVSGELRIYAQSAELADLLERAYQVAGENCSQILSGITPTAVLMADVGALAQELRRRDAIAEKHLSEKMEDFRQMSAQVVTSPTTHLSTDTEARIRLTSRLRRTAARALAMVADLEKGLSPGVASTASRGLL